MLAEKPRRISWKLRAVWWMLEMHPLSHHYHGHKLLDDRLLGRCCITLLVIDRIVKLDSWVLPSLPGGWFSVLVWTAWLFDGSIYSFLSRSSNPLLYQLVSAVPVTKLGVWSLIPLEQIGVKKKLFNVLPLLSGGWWIPVYFSDPNSEVACINNEQPTKIYSSWKQRFNANRNID